MGERAQEKTPVFHHAIGLSQEGGPASAKIGHQHRSIWEIRLPNHHKSIVGVPLKADVEHNVNTHGRYRSAEHGSGHVLGVSLPGFEKLYREPDNIHVDFVCMGLAKPYPISDRAPVDR
jgi:hypothetical protein